LVVLRSRFAARTVAGAVHPSRGLVLVVDDDLSVRRALSRLLRAEGYDVATFATAGEFLAHPLPLRPACLVLDVRLPDMSGLELQRRLTTTAPRLPVVVISGHADRAVREQVLAAKALAFLAKPFDDDALLGAVSDALARCHPP
jgi:FixJ family two-component response regulator